MVNRDPFAREVLADAITAAVETGGEPIEVDPVRATFLVGAIDEIERHGGLTEEMAALRDACLKLLETAEVDS